MKKCAAVKTGHDKTYLTCNLPRKKILTEKCYVKVLKRFEPARPAVENVLYEKELREIFSLALNSICNIPNKVFDTKMSYKIDDWDECLQKLSLPIKQ